MTRISMTFAAVTMTISLAQVAQPVQVQPLSKEAVALMAVLQNRTA